MSDQRAMNQSARTEAKQPEVVTQQIINMELKEGVVLTVPNIGALSSVPREKPGHRGIFADMRLVKDVRAVAVEIKGLNFLVPFGSIKRLQLALPWKE